MGYNKLQKHEREVLKAVRRTWPQATVEFAKGRASTHGLIQVVTPDGARASSSIGSSPTNPSSMVPIVLRNLRNRLAQALDHEHPSSA